MKTSKSPVKEVFIVVGSSGSHVTNWGTGTRVYTRKANAVKQCPQGGKVLRFELNEGEVVHERV